MLDSNDKALWATTLHVEDLAPILPGDGPADTTVAFVERIPAVEDGSRIVIVSPDGIVGDLGPSNSPPQLAVLGASGGESLVIDLATSDRDGDVVWVAALYRPNPSSPWKAVSPFVHSDQIALDTTADLAGSENGELKVIASDGWHTVEVMVPGIEIPQHAPMVTIIDPATGSSYAAGRPVRLQAQAIDSEDGVLDDAAFEWVSDLDGPLGDGAGLTTFELSVGTHVITAEAMDSSGQTANDTVTIRIGPSDLPSAEIREAVASAFAAGGGGGSGPLIAVVVVVLLAAALGAGFFLRSRKLGTPTPSPIEE